MRDPQPTRVRAASALPRRLPHRQLQGLVPDTRASQVHEGLARQAAGDVARGSLSGGREAARTSARARRQVPRPQEVPAPSHHMGRRAEDALLQGADSQPAEGVVPPGPIPQPRQEAGARSGDGTHADTGRQLVQEPTTTRPGSSSQKQVGP